MRFSWRGTARKIYLDSSYSTRDVALAKAAIQGIIHAEKRREPLDWFTVEYFKHASPDLLRRFEKFYVPDFIGPPRAKSCAELWKIYQDSTRAAVKPATIRFRVNVFKRFLRFFGDQVTFNDLNKDVLFEFHDRLKDALSINTVARTVGELRGFANWAMREKIIAENPFLCLDKRFVRVVQREFYVPPDWTTKILDACPSRCWRVLYCLWRHAGLRQQEPKFLTPESVDLKTRRLRVFAPKTEKSRNGGWRVTPIAPVLARELEALLAELPPKSEFLIYKTRRKQYWEGFKAIVMKAGFDPWPRLCQNLRASCENDWVARGFPNHVVAEWMGHSVRTQAEHYLQVIPEFFDAAVNDEDSPIGTSFQGR